MSPLNIKGIYEMSSEPGGEVLPRELQSLPTVRPNYMARLFCVEERLFTGSRILGLGDLGANGLPISVGKLYDTLVFFLFPNAHLELFRDLYVAGAGIKPSSTVPICLDLGTNTQKIIDDPLYIGVRRRRPGVEEVGPVPSIYRVAGTFNLTVRFRKMDAFMKEFMEAMAEVFPSLLVQFEDFSTDNAFRYLDMFKSGYRCFNDDVRTTSP